MPARKAGGAALATLSPSLIRSLSLLTSCAICSFSAALALTVTGITWLTFDAAGVPGAGPSEPGVSGGGRWGEGGDGGAEGGSFRGGRPAFGPGEYMSAASPAAGGAKPGCSCGAPSAAAGAPCSSAACSARTRSPARCASFSKPRCFFMKRCRARSTNLRTARGGGLVRKGSPCPFCPGV